MRASSHYRSFRTSVLLDELGVCRWIITRHVIQHLPYAFSFFLCLCACGAEPNVYRYTQGKHKHTWMSGESPMPICLAMRITSLGTRRDCSRLRVDCRIAALDRKSTRLNSSH